MDLISLEKGWMLSFWDGLDVLNVLNVGMLRVLKVVEHLDVERVCCRGVWRTFGR